MKRLEMIEMQELQGAGFSTRLGCFGVGLALAISLSSPASFVWTATIGWPAIDYCWNH